MRSKKTSGFSLLEMAMVMAIIGLLVGGIMGGKTLMHAAQLKKVLTDAKTYAMAIQQFKVKYGELPGDFTQATTALGTSTVNGDGNGQLSSAGAAGATGENYQLWNQLQMAGMINGSYTGIAGAGSTNNALPGTNVPEGAIKNTGYWHYNWGYQAASATFYEGDYTNTMVFGQAVVNSWVQGPGLTGAEAYDMDKKIDDSYPAFGNVRTLAKTWMSANCGECVSSDTATASAYVRKPTYGVTHGCSLFFLNTFMNPNQS